MAIAKHLKMCQDKLPCPRGPSEFVFVIVIYCYRYFWKKNNTRAVHHGDGLSQNSQQLVLIGKQ